MTRRTRLLGLIALAVIAGAVIGGLAVHEGAVPFSLGGGARDVVVRVTNEGPEDAMVRVTSAFFESGRSMRNDAPLAAGDVEDFALGRVEGQVSITVRVEWARGAFAGSGQRAVVLEEGQCGRGETAVAIVTFQTAQGVSFSPTARGCL